MVLEGGEKVTLLANTEGLLIGGMGPSEVCCLHLRGAQSAWLYSFSSYAWMPGRCKQKGESNHVLGIPHLPVWTDSPSFFTWLVLGGCHL